MRNLFPFKRLLNVFAFVLCLAFFWGYACQEAGKSVQTANPTGLRLLGGNWIAIDFCAFSGTHASVLKAMNATQKPYAYAITLDPRIPDSAECFNGVENYRLPIRIQGDTLIELVGASQGKSVFLAYDAQTNNDLTMYDATGPMAYTHKFIRASNSNKTGYQSFLTALNNQLFPGRFKLGNTFVQFTSEGEVIGLPDYDRYEVCTAGDCFLTGQDIDVLWLSDSKNKDSEHYFGYRYNDDRSVLTLYELDDKTPDEKGTQTIGKAAYVLTTARRMN